MRIMIHSARSTVLRSTAIALGASATIFLLGGCKEYRITTEIARNGSIHRLVAVEGDSSGFGETALAIPQDEEWRESTRPDSQEVGSYWYLFEREFRRVGDLQADIDERPGHRWAVRSRVELEKRHRWFTTWWTWRESLGPAWPLREPAPEEYFTAEELSRLQNDEADSTLSARGEEWQIRTIYEELYTRLRSGAVRLDHPDLSPERFDENRERLFRTIMDAVEEIDDDEIVEALLSICTSFFASPAVADLRPEFEDFGRFYADFMAWYELFGSETYVHTVVMPGIITASGADEIVWNTARWEIEPGEFLYTSRTWEVTSRATNVAALIIVGVLLAGLIMVLTVMVLRRS
jgi:hypothetical protein